MILCTPYLQLLVLAGQTTISFSDNNKLQKWCQQEYAPFMCVVEVCNDLNAVQLYWFYCFCFFYC